VSISQLPEHLPAAWRARAAELRSWSAEAPARVLERVANELEQALRNRGDDVLTLGEAAKVSGYSTDHLGRRVREGSLQNVGRKNAPRVRRKDLPLKANRIAAGPASKYDPVADAQFLLSRRGGQ
jgi:hypothetical protein